MGYGYTYAEALALPSWLFWHLSDASALEQAEAQQRIFQATAMGFGGMKEENVKAIAEGWAETRKRAIPELIKPKSVIELEERRRKTKTPPRMTPERMAAWLSLGQT